MRILCALAIALAGTSCVRQESIVRVGWEPAMDPSMVLPAKPAKLRYSVDLARPGAFDRLQRDNPEHYAKVLAVQHAASRPSCVDDLRALKVELKLDDANCAAMTTLTSHPPKRTVSVMIDGVHYMTFAPIGLEPARSVPLAKSPGITAPLR